MWLPSDQREAQVYGSGVAKDMLDPFSESWDPKTITIRTHWCFVEALTRILLRCCLQIAILFSCILPMRTFPFNYSQGTMWFGTIYLQKVQYQWWIDIQFMFIYMCNGDSCLNYENGVGLYVCYKLQTCHLLTNVTDMIQTQKEEEETLIEHIKSLEGLDSLKRVQLER